MTKPYIEKESFKHKLAKELLASWCKEQEKKYDYCQVGQIKWRRNWGVHVELMFHDTDNPYYFEESEEIKGKFLFKPDITIFHKGTANILIEIVHTSEISEHKLELIKKFFEGYYLEIYEIEAEEILRHTSIPEYLITRREFYL